MLANVSFGILAFHPVGWALMATVIGLEGLAIRRVLMSGTTARNPFLVSFVANLVSGIVGFACSLAINGGWWLVIWVPWVTAHEASAAQWPELAAFMGVAYVSSVMIESVIVKLMTPQASVGRVLTIQAMSNLLSSIFLLAVFWAIGGVPGLRSPAY